MGSNIFQSSIGLLGSIMVPLVPVTKSALRNVDVAPRVKYIGKCSTSLLVRKPPGYQSLFHCLGTLGPMT